MLRPRRVTSVVRGSLAGEIFGVVRRQVWTYLADYEEKLLLLRGNLLALNLMPATGVRLVPSTADM